MARFGAGLFVVVFYPLIFNKGAEGFHGVCPQSQSLSADPDEVTQTLRTGYHFQPPKNWINDPNGPMYYKGLYHFFYQHNPEGAFWGNIIWAHSVSKDLVNWVALKPALYPSKPYDESGCWSGSITIVPEKGPVILYTGYDSQQRQVQAYAIPKNASDPLLRNWVKPDNNPVIIPGTDIDPTAFRDPTTGWRNPVDGYWRILVGGKRNRNSKRGLALLYKSKDFVKWSGSKHPLHSAATGIWECPDFFPVIGERTGLDTSEIGGHVRHVLKVSLLSTAYDVYTIGKYDPYTDRYVPYNTSSDGWDGLRYDYGKFYASKTFFDGRKKRRVLWGWVNESDTHQNDVAKGWAGIQAIPRSVWLDRNGKQLVQWPITELEKLREDKVEVKNKKLGKGQNVEIKGITAAQADVEVTFSILGLEKAEELDPKWVNPADLCAHKGSKVGGGVGPFGLLTLASQNLEEFTPVFFRIFKAQHSKHRVLMCSDATSSSLKSGLHKPSFAGFVGVDIAADRKLSLRSLIDHSVVESFGAGGKTCITSRVYPTLAVGDGARLYAFNDGSEIVTVDHLNAWSMKSPRLMNQNKIH